MGFHIAIEICMFKAIATHLIIRGHGNFSVRGRGPKIFWGDVVGDPNVRSTIRERNFFLFFFNF